MFSRIILAIWLTHMAVCIPAAHAKPIRYVAIGDSYTVATGIEEKDSWPSQLTKKLTTSGLKIDLVKTLGQRGWTSQQTIDEKLPLLKGFNPDFVTLLIGVNNWIREGVSNSSFTLRIKELMDGIQKTLSKPDKLLVLTIPDFSCSPQQKIGVMAKVRLTELGD
jgi:acyl-CoA thioesterase-1